MIQGIPRERWQAALADPANTHAAQALRHAADVAGPLPMSLPPLEPSEAQRGVESAGKGPRTEGLDSLRLTLYGAPRTKKTSNQLQRFGGRLKVVPSAAWMKWRDECLKQVDDSMRLRDQPYNLRAIFYRSRAAGDLINYLQGVADVLQEAEIISDDRWFTGLDGSRLRVDRERPRVVLEITAASLTSE